MIEPLRTATFDAGALIAIERDDRRMGALLRLLVASKALILIPAPVVAEVWRGGARHQARLARFLANGLRKRQIEIVNLDYWTAREVGILLGRSPMSVTDATVCHCARQAGGIVVTSDPIDIRQLIPTERITIV